MPVSASCHWITSEFSSYTQTTQLRFNPQRQESLERLAAQPIPDANELAGGERQSSNQFIIPSHRLGHKSILHPTIPDVGKQTAIEFVPLGSRKDIGESAISQVLQL